MFKVYYNLFDKARVTMLMQNMGFLPWIGFMNRQQGIP